METTQSNLKADFASVVDWRNKTIVEKHLIEEVRKRPPLWNFKLPLVQRSLKIRNNLWEEVAASIDGCI